jgi:hypothetical protein
MYHLWFFREEAAKERTPDPAVNTSFNEREYPDVDEV